MSGTFSFTIFFFSHAASVAIFGACPSQYVTQCTPVSWADFQAGCSRIQGGYFEDDVSGAMACVVPDDVATQVLPCAGSVAPGCEPVPDANFTAGCKALGGFVSGYVYPGEALSVCSVPGVVSQVFPCFPKYTSCTVMPGFYDWCTASGGFNDATVGFLPECTLRGPVSSFVPCNGSTTSGCVFQDAQFRQTCTALGGFITGINDQLPLCRVVGKVGLFEPCPLRGKGQGCSYDTNAFTTSCQKLGGFVLENGGLNLPQCAFRYK